MATQIVMDATGDTRHEFDPADAAAVAEAENRFRELTGAGFTAAVRKADGSIGADAQLRSGRQGDGILSSTTGRLRRDP